MRRGMHIGQALFFLGIEPGIPLVRPWKELLVTIAQTTWFERKHFRSIVVGECIYYTFNKYIFFLNVQYIDIDLSMQCYFNI